MKKALLSFQDFKKKFYREILPNKHKDIREGQLLMNFLGDVWFEEYQRISSVHFYDRTDIDCFYNDSLIPNTLEHLEEVWKS